MLLNCIGKILELFFEEMCIKILFVEMALMINIWLKYTVSMTIWLIITAQMFIFERKKRILFVNVFVGE